MTLLSEQDLLRQTREERDFLRHVVAERLRKGANLAPVLFGIAALLGDTAAAGALPGHLDPLLDRLAGTMRQNAVLQLDAQANTPARGNG